ncbi:MAG: hypothetical protein MJD61_13820 [Proteobacteria bacterium]|nr:hypothetical protein [Pseudomonadota bacterium]
MRHVELLGLALTVMPMVEAAAHSNAHAQTVANTAPTQDAAKDPGGQGDAPVSVGAAPAAGSWRASPDRGVRSERASLEVHAGLWVPGPMTFGGNHRISAHFAAEASVHGANLFGHRVFVGGGLQYSAQRLERHLQATHTTMLLGYGFARYSPTGWCNASGRGCFFMQLGLGLTFETAPHEPEEHHAPKAELTVLFGAGYRYQLARSLTIGARIDTTYLEEDAQRQIGWLSPSVLVAFTP